jgi:hypothetical protein
LTGTLIWSRRRRNYVGKSWSRAQIQWRIVQWCKVSFLLLGLFLSWAASCEARRSKLQYKSSRFQCRLISQTNERGKMRLVLRNYRLRSCRSKSWRRNSKRKLWMHRFYSLNQTLFKENWIILCKKVMPTTTKTTKMIALSEFWSELKSSSRQSSNWRR